MTRISDMTTLTTLPATGAYVPVEKTGSSTNYRFDLSALSNLDGLFTNIGNLTIPSGVNAISTTGHAALGVGGANYIADGAVDAAYAAAHPLTSFISANLRGFRLDLEQDLTPQMAGGKNDLTVIGAGTDNSPAINALVAAHTAQAKCAKILFPKGVLAYRCASTIVSFYGVKFVGDGWHENPGTVGGTTYSAPQHLRGSILAFDADVAGFQFIDFTDNLANATAYEFEGSRYSVVEDLLLWGGGGTSTSAHGVETRTIIHMRNVRIENFAGNDLLVTADTTGANPYGNASLSKFDHCFFLGAGMHGARIKGIDASVIKFDTCNFANNGGVGYFDDTHIGGNNLVGCHFATNNRSYGASTAQRTAVVADCALLADQYFGSIHISNVSTTPHWLAGIYVESGTGSKAHAPAGTLVVGGILGQVGSALFDATSAPTIIDGTGIIQSPGPAITATTGIVTLNHPAGSSVDTVNSAGGTVTARMKPGPGTYANFQLMGNGNSVANGMDILAGGAAGYFSADTIVHRNAAQAVTFNTSDATGFNINTGVLKVAATQVVGARGAAVADAAALTSVDATNAAAAPTQAEFNAFVAEFNKLRTDLGSTRTALNSALARLRIATGHGLIA